LALFAAVWVFAVNRYYVEIQRQRSERFDVVGVHLSLPRSGVFRIGAGDLSAEGSTPDSLDVRLEPSSDVAQRWAVTLRRDPTRRGFIVDSMEGVESLQQKRDWSRSSSRRLWERVVRFDPAWVQLWGDELSLSSPDVNAIAARAAGPTHHFRLIESGDGRFLEWNGERAPLVLPDSSPMFDVLGRRLTMADTVRVVSHGKRWSFVLANHARGPNRDPGIAVRFVRGPDPRLGWLPSDEVCGTQRRCTLISTSRLPPSVPHFYLGAFGL